MVSTKSDVWFGKTNKISCNVIFKVNPMSSQPQARLSALSIWTQGLEVSALHLSTRNTKTPSNLRESFFLLKVWSFRFVFHFWSSCFHHVNILYVLQADGMVGTQPGHSLPDEQRWAEISLKLLFAAILWSHRILHLPHVY